MLKRQVVNIDKDEQFKLLKSIKVSVNSRADLYIGHPEVYRYFDKLINFSIKNDYKRFSKIDHYFEDGIEELLRNHPRIKSISFKLNNENYVTKIYVYLKKRELTNDELKIIKNIYLEYATKLLHIFKINKYFVINLINKYIKESKTIEEFERKYKNYCEKQFEFIACDKPRK